MKIGRGTRQLILLFATFSSLSAYSQPAELPPAKAVDPVDGILQAFADHSVVALAEGAHKNIPAHEVRMRLIRDPRFAVTVDDIVVEFGNARHQEMMDRFTRGGAVSDFELRRIWQDTTQVSGVWDVPIYEEFFRAVRTINAGLPADRQLRVLLGDPPIDWGIVKNFRDLEPYLSRRDRHAVQVIRNDVLAKGRRALVIYGGIHFLRHSLHFQIPDQREAEELSRRPVNSIVSLLEADGTTRVFSIVTATNVSDWSMIQPDIVKWTVPSFARVADTQVGLQPFGMLEPEVRMFRIVDGVRRGFDLDLVKSHRIQDQFDAILYIGARADLKRSERPASLCRDPSYMQMRLSRIRMTAHEGVADPAGWFERECASQNR